MKTILDDARWLFLENIVTHEGYLMVAVIEASTLDKPKDTVVDGIDFGKSWPIEPTDDSRRFIVGFSSPLAWQVMDETHFCAGEETDETVDDGGYLQVVEGAAYTNYVVTFHPLFTVDSDHARHYRLRTNQSIIDVITYNTPTVSLKKPGTSPPD